MTDPSAAVPTVALDPEERDLIRSLILSDPELVLSDDQVMRALIRATGTLDRNVVDLRDKLVERLEMRLSKLVRTNRSVIAAAYENVASTRQVHRAVLMLIEAPDLPAFLRALTEDVPRLVSVEVARLCLEADVDDVEPARGLGPEGRAVVLLPRGIVGSYLTLHPERSEGGVVLREATPEAGIVFGERAVASEALLRLDLPGRTGLLALGSTDPDRFSPDQGTELLDFFARVVGRLAAGHLSAADGIA